MRLEELAAAAQAQRTLGDPAVEVSGLAYDSRTVEPGTLFFCVVGEKRRRARVRRPGGRARGGGAGRRARAGARRAAGRGRRRAGGDGADRGALLRRPDRRAAGGRDHRHQRQDDDGLPAARGAGGGGGPVRACSARSSRWSAAVEEEVERTTPEAIDLQRTFRRMLEGGDRACAMEVSSHALALHRVDAIHFELGALHQPDPGPPRLPRRHGGLLPLEARLFADVRPEKAVVNVDDPYGRRLAEEFECLTFSAEGAEADFSAPRRLLRRLRGGLHRRRAPEGGDRGPHDDARPLQRRQRARRLRRGDRDGGRAARGGRRAWRGRGASRAASSRSTRGRTSPSSSTTPTRRTRWTTSSPPRGG